MTGVELRAPYKDVKQLLPAYAEVSVVNEVFLGYDVLPPRLVSNLIDLSENLGERKHNYTWNDIANIPRPIQEAALFFQDIFQMPSDTAVIKRYDTFESYVSTAFRRHADPTKYAQHRIALTSLSGEAIFTAWSRNGKEHPIRCRSNTIVVLPGDLEHKVTPPLNPDGVRHLLFLGKTSFEASLYSKSSQFP